MNAPARNFIAKEAKRCEHCGAAYRVKPSKVAGSRFCSRACKNIGLRTLPEAQPRTCPGCGQSFTPRRKKAGQVHCSKSCIWKAQKGPEYNAVLARKYAPIIADRIRGTGSKGYVKRGGRHEHRVVAEQMLGRPLRPGEVVHHRNHDKHDNRPSNLEVLTQHEHMLAHGIGVPGKPLTWEPWKYRGRKTNERSM